MDAAYFHQCANAALSALEDALEAKDSAGMLEVEAQGGILTVAVAGRQFVLNKHEPTRQIWLASPVSGAARFVYHEPSGHWLHTVTGEELQAMVTKETEQGL